METICNSLLKLGYTVWNAIVGELAWGLFKQNPKAAFTNEYEISFYMDVVRKVFNAMKDIMVPLLLLFFVIKTFKELITTPWEQFYKKIIYSVLHFFVISFICFNLWTINGVFIDCTQAVANSMFKGLEGYHEDDVVHPKPKPKPGESGDEPDVADESIDIAGVDIQMSFEDNNDPTLSAACEELDECNFLERAIGYVLIMLACAGAALAWSSSAIMILKAAYTRLIQPLIMLPFAGIAVAMSAGTENMGRTTYAFYKQIAIFILAGPFMALCCAAAKFMTIAIDPASDASALTKALLMIATVIIRPMIIAGLVKGASQTIQQFSS